MKELPGTLGRKEIAAIRELEPLYDRLSLASGRDAVSRIREDLNKAQHKYAALAIDSLLVRSVFELLEAAWLLRQIHWNRELVTGSSVSRITDGLAKARQGLMNYRWLSSLDDKNRIERLLDYCTNEAILGAIARP